MSKFCGALQSLEDNSIGMATLSRKIRSISLPPRSHPSTAQVEEELGKLRSWESTGDFSSSGSIGIGLSGLEKLYIHLDYLLSMSSTQQVLSHQDHHINELLDMSVTILDVCRMTGDLVSQIKEHVRELESALRRRKGDSSIKKGSVDYANLRWKMKKDARRLIATIRQTDSHIIPTQILDCDQHLSAVIRVLREVNSSSISVLRSVLLFLSTSGPTTGQTKWLLVSRLMLKGAEENMPKLEVINEFEHVGSALRALCSKGSDKETSRALQKRFAELDVGIGGIEDGLERMLRRLVKTRATLLNIISQ